MPDQKPQESIALDLGDRPEATKDFILRKCNEWDCSPSEATTRLLDHIAKEDLNKEAA